MDTIYLTESEMSVIWRLASEFNAYDLIDVQDRRFTATVEGVTPRCIITVRALHAPRWTISVLPRYSDANFVGDFSGSREGFDRDLFMLRMLWD